MYGEGQLQQPTHAGWIKMTVSVKVMVSLKVMMMTNSSDYIQIQFNI